MFDLTLISLLLTNTVSPVRACLSIQLERFRRAQKEDDRGPLRIKSSLKPTNVELGRIAAIERANLDMK
jgi:hypothetical protein